MAVTDPNVQIIVPGKFIVFLGRADSPNVLQEVGEMRDNLVINFEESVYDIHGDSRGGDAGHPIEQQFLGQMGYGTLEFVRWNPTVIEYFETSGGILDVPGYIPDCKIGALKLQNHSFRMLFYPIRNQSRLRNFVCVTARRFHVIGGGTKHEHATLELQFHRAPCGHLKQDYIYDKDTTGLPAVDIC